MSLADRLAQARRDRTPVIEERAAGAAAAAPAPPASRSAPAGTGLADPFADLKRQVHQALLDTLGPKLYDARLTQSEMEQKVRQTLQEVLSTGEMPLTSTDRARIAQEISDDILGYGPIEPYLRDVDVTEIMVNGPDQIFVERAGRIYPVDGRVRRRGAPAPHDRQDRGPGRAAGRRVQPDGRRPAARRQPRQRHHPAARRRRLAADHPQVRRRPADRRGPRRVRHHDPGGLRLPVAPASGAGSTSWSAAAPAPARPRP